MDIDLLSKMVKELILDNDKVVLPGLGCFVAEVVPAYFSDKGYTINPPYRKLYFRARPDEGDSLSDFYARSNNVSHDVAERIIKDFVSELKAVLHSRKVVVFPGLGRLRATKENNVFFVADEDLDIYPEGFGLEPISLKTHQETPEEVNQAVVGLKSLLSEPETVTEPEPVIEPEPPVVPDPVIEQETMTAPEPDPVIEPSPMVDVPEIELVEPEEETKPVEEPESVEEAKPDKKPEKTGGKGLKALIAVAVVLILIVAAYMVVGRLCPEWIDSFLYTPEELEILRR